jgi:hypothetical protein
LYPPHDHDQLTSSHNEYIFNLSSIEARIHTIGNTEIIEKFQQFSTARVSVWTAVSELNAQEAYEEFQNAKKLGGEILELLFKEQKKIKPRRPKKPQIRRNT